MLNDWKLRLGSLAFKRSGVRRIHIIGCARSGTTFLQYCMLAYDGTRVANAETSPHYPGLRGKSTLALQSIKAGELTYVTKRPYGWFFPEKIDELIRAVDLYDMGIILMIRDPRAVLRSVHKRAGATPYVEEERWYESILAGEEIWRRLENHHRKCVVKYEDLVAQPDDIDHLLRQTFSLELRAGMARLNQVKTNIERLQYNISGPQEAAMHTLRDADASSLGAPGDVPDFRCEAARAKFNEILARYYNQPSPAALPASTNPD